METPNLVELTHDEHRHPHEVEDAVEEHPQHPRRAGGDLGQVEPEAVLGVTGGAVDPPVWEEEEEKKKRRESEKSADVSGRRGRGGGLHSQQMQPYIIQQIMQSRKNR